MDCEEWWNFNSTCPNDNKRPPMSWPPMSCPSPYFPTEEEMLRYLDVSIPKLWECGFVERALEFVHHRNTFVVRAEIKRLIKESGCR